MLSETIKCQQCGKEIENSAVDFKCPHCGCEYRWDSLGIMCEAIPTKLDVDPHKWTTKQIDAKIKELKEIKFSRASH
jgi:tRNA(Ile2) C34 agmatinyltransferase TiaS